MEKKKYLFAFDFDGTIARTFEKSPGGIGVNEANARAVRDVFGPEGAAVYEAIGGLKNRAPSELALEIMSNGNRGVMLEHAKEFKASRRLALTQLVPEGKGISLNDEQLTDPIIGEMLVRQKLSHLLPQIGLLTQSGKPWPEDCAGFTDLYKTIKDINSEGGVRIDTAIISSGHDAFIQATFSAWQQLLPDILVTEDDIRGREYPKEMARRVKPGTFPLALAQHQWAKAQGLSQPREILESRNRLLYFGDDSNKDVGMAENSRVMFGWFNPSGKEAPYPNGSLVFADWAVVARLLNSHVQKMKEGKPVREIFTCYEHA